MIIKLKEWIRRYLPAEIAGTIAAILGALAGMEFSESPMIAALTGTWAENIGFYGYSTIREARAYVQRFEPACGPKRYTQITYNTFRNLILEFGASELFDSFFSRPFFLYIIPKLLGNFVIGIIAGKIIADFFFYGVTIGAYELRKKWLRQ